MSRYKDIKKVEEKAKSLRHQVAVLKKARKAKPQSTSFISDESLDMMEDVATDILKLVDEELGS